MHPHQRLAVWCVHSIFESVAILLVLRGGVHGVDRLRPHLCNCFNAAQHFGQFGGGKHYRRAKSYVVSGGGKDAAHNITERPGRIKTDRFVRPHDNIDVRDYFRGFSGGFALTAGLRRFGADDFT